MGPEKRFIDLDIIKLNGECFFDTAGTCHHIEKSGIKCPDLKCELYKYLKQRPK